MVRAVIGALLLALTLLLAPAARADDPAAGFRSILPPGQAGTDNALQFGVFQATGRRPAHWDDQLAPYAGLIRASPTLTAGDLGRFFKDAPLTPAPGDVGATETPRPGVRIVREASSGVPHVFGATRADVMWGAGWVGAEDRLFLMDVLRHTARATLSAFAGGDPGNRAQDAEQWAVAPYTEDDLSAQLTAAARDHGAAGAQVVSDLDAYVAGINAWIASARLDVTKRPSEYALIGRSMEDWRPTDVVATASLINGIYGVGGGGELGSAAVLHAAEARFGRRAGRRAWADFRQREDPRAPFTLGRRFPYRTGSPFAPRGLALPDAGSVRSTPVASPASVPRAAPRPPRLGPFRLPRRGASNALLVSARESRSGRPLAVMGPEVGFFDPQILMEEGLHGPGIDARGAAFPGINLYVLIGHGAHYAWSPTSAYTDVQDTFAEVLCHGSDHYRWRGRCRPMETLAHVNCWKPTVADSTPAGCQTVSVQRTVHGIVVARGRVHGRPVAFARQRSSYFHEGDAALGFSRLDDPGAIRGPRSFGRAIAQINSTFNWFYLDSRHIAYFSSGAFPVRARGVSSDLPVLGTGAYDWRGFDPARHTFATLPFARHPQAIDPPYLVNWNNRPAPGFAAADDNWGSSRPDHVDLLRDKVRKGIRGRRKLDLTGLVRAMEETATQDVRGTSVLPALLRAVGRPRDPRLRAAIAALTAWRGRGAHRRDLDGDGHYDDDAAVTLMDAWWPRAVHAEFDRALGPRLLAAIEQFKPIGNEKGGAAESPDFCCGFYPYVVKDLAHALSRSYCGPASRCRAVLRRSLLAATRVTHAELYGHAPECAGQAEASCHDLIRSTTVGGIDIPPFAWAQRPTYQQAVEVPGGG